MQQTTSRAFSFMLTHFFVGGGNRRAFEIINWLAKKKYKVTIFSGASGRPNWMEIHPSVEFRYIEDVTRTKHDVLIHIGYNHTQMFEEAEAKLKVYYVLNCQWKYIPDRADAIKKSIKCPYFRLANSNWVADCVEQELNVERPIIVDGGIDHEQFHPVKVEKEYPLLCMGTSNKNKGVDILEQAAELAELPLVKFADKGLPQDKLAEEYSKAEIFLSGSYYEGWNQPVLEAMACGVPVVKTRDGGSSHFAKNGYNCLEAPTGDIFLIAKQIKRLRESPELRKKLIANGLETAAKYSWEKTAKHFLKAIKEVT